MTPEHPSGLRLIHVLVRLAGRRYFNRLSGVFFRRLAVPRDKPAPRRATPRKSGARVLAVVLVAAMCLPQGFLFASSFLQKLSAWRAESPAQGDDGIDPVRDAFEGRQAAPDAERSGGPTSRSRHPWGGFRWPESDLEPRFLAAIGVFLTLFFLSLAIVGLGMGNQDLGRLEWSFEWLFTLPVGARTLYAAKALEYALTATFPWFTVFPLFAVLYWHAGHAWAGIGLAIVATAYVNVLLGSFRALAETWLRKRLSLGQLKNLQAVATVAGILCFYALYYLSFGRSELPDWFTALSEAAPALVSWSPIAVPVLAASAAAPPWAPPAVMAGVGAAAVAASASLAAWLVRDGLVKDGGGPFQGSRPRAGNHGTATSAAQAQRPSRLRGIVAKELTLLRRDRSFFVQTLIVPILIIGFQLAVNPALLEAGGRDLRHGAMIAFGIGAYVLMFGAFSTLAVEGNGLWLLYTLPRSLASVLRQKAALWAALSVLYTGGVLGLITLRGGPIALESLPSVAMALAGSVTYAFIAAGFGVLGTNPLEENVHRKVHPTYHYLYMLVASLYGYGVYAPELWSKIVVVVLTGLLAFALWQKVKVRLPYLLDPTDAPPPAILLSDGLVAVFAFFALQGVVSILLVAGFGSPAEAPFGLILFIAFAVAGGVVTPLALYLAWRAKVPRLLQVIGLQGEPGRTWPAHRALLLGAALGAAAAAAAQLYLRVAETSPALRRLKEKAMNYGDLIGEAEKIWLIVLAVVLAPLFEEVIFRGLVFRGLRRTVNRWTAVLASAALFAIVHPPFSAIPVFVLGVAAALSFEVSGLLLAPIAAHAVYNAVVVWAQ